MKKPKLLYIGHAYHNKTKSTQFLKDMLAEKYDVEIFDFDPYNDDINTHFLPLKGKEYEVAVIFQIMPHLDKLRKVINFKKSAFFPMYDGVPSREDPIWYEYKDTQIINFSKTLHEELHELGYSSRYVQFFPTPLEIANTGKTDSVFFWQRINPINAKTVEILLKNSNISHMHIHKVPDPQHEYIEPSEDNQWNITYSEWFDTRAEMQTKMQESAIYIAPRLYEGIGMSFLEAMAMGRCVIAPDNPTMNEYIKDGENGYLYDPQNPQPLTLANIRDIQQNTIRYIKEGYEKWEQEKYQILDWVEEKVKTNIKIPTKYEDNQVEIVTYKLFSVLPIIKVKQTRSSKKVYFLGILPLFEINGD